MKTLAHIVFIFIHTTVTSQKYLQSSPDLV